MTQPDIDAKASTDRVPRVKVPGAGAAEVRLSAVLNSFPRWLLKTKCSFSGFLRSLIQSPVAEDRATTMKPGSPTWPMPLPFPEAFRQSGHVSGMHKKRLVCLQIALLDWLALGCPKSPPREIRLGVKPSPKQWSAIGVIQFLAWDSNSPEFIDAESMGRAASKIENFQDELGALHRSISALLGSGGNYTHAGELCRPPEAFDPATCRSGFLVGKLCKEPVCTAKPVEASRITFPGPPKFNPRPFVDERTLDIFESPLKHAVSPQQIVLPLPKVRVHADEANKVALYKLLADSGRLQPVNIPQGRHGIVSGVFSVVKDLNRDRLILDARRPNALETTPGVWTATMASASTLVDLVLHDSQNLVASGEDLRDYFYQFVTTEERTTRNVMASPLTAAQAEVVFGRAFAKADEPVWCGLSTLAMGDLNSCEVAQAAHVGLCLQNGVVQADELLTLRGSVPRGLLSVGIIIDDLVLLEKVLKTADLSSQACISSRRLESALRGYAAADLEVNMKKEFRTQLQARFWGIELDGEKGLIRPSSLRMWPVVLITARVAMLGLCSVSLMEALAGSWIALFSVRRRLMCCLELIFEAMGIPDQHAVIRLSDEMVSELWTLCLLAPLAVTNLRAQFNEQLIATDSSLDYTAGVEAHLPAPIAQEVAKRSLKRGIWSRLLPSAEAWKRGHGLLPPEDEVPGESYKCHPLWEVLARGLHYKEQWRRKILVPKHINVTELGAHLHAEKRLARNKRHVRTVFGLDSQVSLGALVKGRAASSRLNSMLRSAIPWALGSDLYSYFLYFPSAFNRADAPTRHAEVPRPDVSLPAWWDDAAMGIFRDFDSWLETAEAGLDKEPFDLTSLSKKAAVDIRSERAVRDDARAEATQRRTPVSKFLKRGKKRVLGATQFEEADVRPGGLCQEAIDLLRTFSPKQFFFRPGTSAILAEPGVLDLFSGNYGVAKNAVRHGAPWVLTFELKRSRSENLLDAELREKLNRLVELGAFLVGAAPTCSSFSTAVTPPVRSKRFPRGLPNVSRSMKAKIRESNSHADFLWSLILLQVAAGGYFWFENPDRSFMWQLRQFAEFRAASSAKVCRVSFCRFGTPWQKNTKVGTNVPSLCGLRMMCTCKRKHQVLRGRSKFHGKSWTAVAEPYPRGFANLLAHSCCVAAKWSEDEKLDVAGCSRCMSLRPGEASNPGPRGRTHVRNYDLETVQLRTPATEHLEARLLARFLDWVGTEVRSISTSTLFDISPAFAAQALKAFGLLEFKHGEPLSNYRHLILSVQNWKPAVRPHTAPCWQLVSKWELSEPISHRPPIPESVVKAMIVFAWHRRWYAWCGVTLIAFYGAGRIGETLHCQRCDLLFPQDILEVKSECVFLQLKQFKSLGRQPSRVQHMKITDKIAIALLFKIYYSIPNESALYPAGPSVYRKRWDFLLKHLGVPTSAQLTPGCLRAGASVMAYRNGKPIHDILWMMRLRNQQTLETYLQEVAALATLRDLPECAKTMLFSVASLFEHLQFSRNQVP